MLIFLFVSVHTQEDIQVLPQAAQIPQIFKDLHQPIQLRDELQVAFYVQEFSSFPILMYEYYSKKKQNQSDILNMTQEAFKREPMSAKFFIVDCDNFNSTMNKTTGTCYQNESSFALFVPKEELVVFKGEEIPMTPNKTFLGGQLNYQILTGKLSEALPRALPVLDDKFDLQIFLQRSKRDKAIFLDDVLAQNKNYRKLHYYHKNRLDISITDDPQLLKEFGNFKMPALIVLNYNFTSKSYSHRLFQGFVQPFQSQSLRQMAEFLQDYAWLTRQRYFVLDLSLSYGIRDLTVDKIGKLALQDDRLLILQVDGSLYPNFISVSDLEEKYGSLFIYGKMTWDQDQFYGFQVPCILVIDDSLQDAIMFTDNFGALRAAFPNKPKNSYRLINNYDEAQNCMMDTAREFRLPVIFNSRTPFQDFLVQYSLRDRIVRHLVRFCKANTMDQPGLKRLGTPKGGFDFMTLDQKQSHQGTGFKVARSPSISSFGQFSNLIKQQLRKLIRRFINQVQSLKLEQAKSSQTLQQNCQAKDCLLIFVNPTSQQFKRQIQVQQKLTREFSDRFKTYWIDGLCNKHVLQNLKVSINKLPALAIYNQRTKQYKLYKGRKYLDQREARKWVKQESRKSEGYSRMRTSLDFDSFKCKDWNYEL